VEWAILNGLEKTGVTIMQMSEGLDSGPILHQIPHRIPNDVTGGDLSEHLAELGAQALVEALELLEANMLKPIPQKDADATYAPKLTREVARITLTGAPDIAMRQTLALDPRPGAWAELDGREVKLFRATTVEMNGKPGEVLKADQDLVIAVGRGAIAVAEVQPAGKPRMPAADWVRGRGVAVGQRFT
jgi:methionyl-tRNA formyltransferase